MLLFLSPLALFGQDTNNVSSRDNKPVSVEESKPAPVRNWGGYPIKNFPRAKFSGVKTPGRDIGGKRLTLKMYDEMLAQKRQDFHKRLRKNRKLDRKIEKKMRKEWYFLLQYGYIPKKSIRKKNHM